jgi:hypothetical protein
MRNLSHLVTADSVFERTRAGQCELLNHECSLGPIDKRLLAIVTGYTPLGDLLALLGETTCPSESVYKLLEDGLIKIAEKKNKKRQRNFASSDDNTSLDAH